MRRYIPEEPVTFADWVDDDGMGNGPFKIVADDLARGRHLRTRLDGHRRAGAGPINFHINEGLCKLFFGVYLIMAFDPSILFNEGSRRLRRDAPGGVAAEPEFPAAVSNRLNVHIRFFDCMSGAMGQRAPDLAMAAGYGASPYFVFSGTDDHDSTSSSSSCCSAGCPAGRAGTASTGTRGGRCSARRRSSTPRRTTRCV